MLGVWPQGLDVPAGIGLLRLGEVGEKHPFQVRDAAPGHAEVGIAVPPDRAQLVEGSVQYPIVNEPNGRQLATSWTTLFGIRVLLF